MLGSCFTLRATPLIALLVTVLMGCDESPKNRTSPADEALNVVVQQVYYSNQRTRVEAVGTSRAKQSIVLYPAISGEVVDMLFKPGQFVKQDDVLLELDQRDAKLAVELAQVKLADAERLYDRYVKSADSGATLPTTLDAAKTALDSARIELDRAQVALDDRTVTAPFSGFLGITDIDTGDRIQTTTPITTLDDRRTLLVSFDVPELLMGELQQGDDIGVATWNASGLAATGKIIEIDSRINPLTRTFVARAEVDNSEDRLRPGMSFRVNLDLAGERYPALAEVSLQWGAEGSYVWTITEGTAKRVTVNIVQRQRGIVLVEADLQAGDLVVVEGLQRLRPGLAVDVQSVESVNELVPAATPVINNVGPG